MKRRAFSLAELLIVCAMIGIMTGIAAPRIRIAMDSLAVEAATRDAMNAFTLARYSALRFGGADARIDTLSVTVSAAGHVVRSADVVHAHGVRLTSNTLLVKYDATGLGVGLSNGTLIITRGAAADTIIVSRLGRARRSH